MDVAPSGYKWDGGILRAPNTVLELDIHFHNLLFFIGNTYFLCSKIKVATLGLQLILIGFANCIFRAKSTHFHLSSIGMTCQVPEQYTLNNE